jgi:hypothetical protein
MGIELNANILGEIACKLDIRDFVSMTKVCKQWNRLGEEDSIWQRLAQRDFPAIPKETHQTWKELYKARFYGDNVLYFEEIRKLPCPTQEQIIGMSFRHLPQSHPR